MQSADIYSTLRSDAVVFTTLNSHDKRIVKIPLYRRDQDTYPCDSGRPRCFEPGPVREQAYTCSTLSESGGSQYI